jgi:hypothetical protein
MAPKLRFSGKLSPATIAGSAGALYPFILLIDKNYFLIARHAHRLPGEWLHGPWLRWC